MGNLSVVFTVALIAYVWCNELSNQNLLDGMQQLEEPFSYSNKEDHFRVRREIKPSNCTNGTRSFHPCCRFDLPAHPKNFHDIGSQCYNESTRVSNRTFYFPWRINSTSNYTTNSSRNSNVTAKQRLPYQNERMHKLKIRIACFWQCMAQKQNLVDTNNNLVLDKLVKKMSEEYNGTWVKLQVETIAKKCLNYTEADKTERLNTIQAETKCSIAYHTFESCVHRHIQMNCPEKYVNNRGFCAILRGEKKTPPSVVLDKAA